MVRCALQWSTNSTRILSAAIRGEQGHLWYSTFTARDWKGEIRISGFGTVSFGPQEFVFNNHCTSVYCEKINHDRGNARHGKCPIWTTLFCGLRVTNNLFLPIASFNIILNNKSSRLRKRLLLLNLIWKIGKPHPSTTARLIFGRFSRFWESFLSGSRTSKIFALTDRHRNVTAKNRYACHDFSAWNKRQQSHYLSQNVEPSRA